MNRWLCVIVLVTTAFSPRVVAADEPARDATSKVVWFRYHLGKADTVAAAGSLAPTVKTGALWFADPACARRFARPHVVTAGEREQLLQCLVGLGPLPLGRTVPHGTLGFERNVLIGVTATSAGITSLQSFGADATEPPILTIDGHARHAEKIDNFAPSEKVLALVDDRASTTVRVCSNERGSVTKANIVATSGIPGYDAEVLAETKRWKRAPYAPQGRPVAVCEIFKLITVVGVVGVGLEGGEVGGVVGSIGSPPPPPPPPPHPSPMNIPPGTLEQFRKTGERAIVPDDKTKLKLQTSGQSKLVGAFKLCVNSSGDVTRVSAIRSTGFPEYDTKLIDTMKTTWSYRPVIVDGKAKAVCTAITFIYSQL